jgi:hypothetical protein
LRSLSFRTRREVLRGAASVAAGAFVAEAVGPALADGALDETLAKGLAMPLATIFVAKKIVTMERDNPTAAAVAVEAAGSSPPARSTRLKRRWAPAPSASTRRSGTRSSCRA